MNKYKNDWILILKTTSSFSTSLKNTLEEIVDGHHNDANCKKYQEQYVKDYGKASPPCKFKDHPELIPNLLEKIFIDSDGKVSRVAKLKSFFESK